MSGQSSLDAKLKDIGAKNSYSPVFINANGQFHRVPSGSILDIGGVSSSYFTVGGKGVMLADGSSSDGSSGVTLQHAFINSVAQNNFVKLRLDVNKGLSISDYDGQSDFVKFDPSGKVTISGELRVDSAVVKFVGAYQEADHWNILASDGSKTALLIEPKSNVVYTTNVIRVRSKFDGPIDFSINQNGETYIRSLVVGSFTSQTINDLVTKVDLLQQDLNLFLGSENTQVQNLSTKFANIDKDIADLDDRIDTVESQINEINSTPNIVGVEFKQMSGSTVWTVRHNTNTKKIQFSLYDENHRFMIPDDAFPLDDNTFIISFGSNQTGTAVLMCIKPPVVELLS